MSVRIHTALMLDRCRQRWHDTGARRCDGARYFAEAWLLVASVSVHVSFLDVWRDCGYNYIEPLFYPMETPCLANPCTGSGLGAPLGCASMDARAREPTSAWSAPPTSLLARELFFAIWRGLRADRYM